MTNENKKPRSGVDKYLDRIIETYTATPRIERDSSDNEVPRENPSPATDPDSGEIDS